MAQPGLVSVIEEENIGALQHSENSEGWEMGDIQYELGFFFSFLKSHFICTRTVHSTVPSTSI